MNAWIILKRTKTIPKTLKEGCLEFPITIGEHIRKKRMDLGLYQSDVGKMFGVSKDCITYWENGRNEPQIKYYPRIISFLWYNPIAADESTIAGQVFAYRCVNGFSQRRLAKLLNVDPTIVKAWEMCASKPSKKLIKMV